MVNFKEIYHFSRFQRGPTFSRGGGGVQLFPGGFNCLFPIETHITCDFRGGGPDPLPPPPPLWIGSHGSLRLPNKQCIITGKQPNQFTNCDETKKRALNTQAVRTRGNLPIEPGTGTLIKDLNLLQSHH